MLCSKRQSAHLSDGIYAAALMPMRSDLICDHEALATHCFSLIRRGCTGVVLFGTTGEGPSLSLRERIDALNDLISCGLDPQKLIVANGGSCLTDTVSLGREAAQNGCLVFLVCPPSFYKNVEDDGIIAFYREVIHRIDNPTLSVLLYHIPQLSGVSISTRVIKTLLEQFPEIVVGIKESEGNAPFMRELINTFPGFKVFVGSERQIIESVSLGGAGSICGIANLYPELICSLYDSGKSGTIGQQEKIESVFSALKGLQFIPAAKAVMQSRQGAIWHALRPPLIPLGREQADQLVNALRNYELEGVPTDRVRFK